MSAWFGSIVVVVVVGRDHHQFRHCHRSLQVTHTHTCPFYYCFISLFPSSSSAVVVVAVFGNHLKSLDH